MSTTMGNIGDVVPGAFIVFLKDGSYTQTFEDRINNIDDRHAKLLTTYKAISACRTTLSDSMAQELRNDDNVDRIEQVRVVGLNLPDASLGTTATQPNALWNLNRVCERVLGVNGPYHAPATGEDITAYVVDTGIYTEHEEFNDRRASWGANFVWDSENVDENGHGTHVAGTIGGTTYGVAKGVRIVGVKVLDGEGMGSTSTVVDGLNWVFENATPGKSVVNVSLGGGRSRAINDMITKLYDKNIPVFAAAGNDPQVNSEDGSPSGSPNAYTVASINWLDQPSRFNSRGENVDMLAPGERILSAYKGGKTATKTIDGTSMATPHVTGIAAIYLSLRPDLDVGDIYRSLSQSATPDSLSGNLKRLPNRIVYNTPV